ncbi:MAG: hypothetical protein WCO78_02745 [Candidatus Roizmanbacteria bacterium]
MLQYLYAVYEKTDTKNKYFLNKPIIIEIVSIIEAILYDFHMRINKNTGEGVHNISISDRDDIRSKKLDDFDKYITSTRKHALFGQNMLFYEKLHYLRKIRNRIHTQNSENMKPYDDRKVFSTQNKIFAEGCLEKVAKVMSKKYARPNYVNGYVPKMTFPWKERIVAKEKA